MLPAVLLFMVPGLWAGCGPNRHELLLRLDDRDQELYARSQQFMTDNQKDTFLELPDAEARERFVEELHIAERLNKFEPHVREAIMAGRIVPGMTVEAVLLSWGRPLEIERRDVDGVPAERWAYQRGERDGRLVEKQVHFLRGLVTEVTP